MQKKVSGSVLSRSSNNPLLLLLSCLACLYVAGRLWEDSIARKELLLLAQQKVESQDQSQAVSTRVTVDESVKLVRYKEQEKQLAILETQLAAAKLKGFVPDGFNNVNSSSKVLLAVIGVNTGFGEKKRRDSLRSTWFPTGEKLKELEEKHGVVMRFTIGRSPNKGDTSDRLIEKENELTNDFLILEDHVEAYDELPKKTKNFFATSVQRWVADFYVKVDDDVFVDIDRLIDLLESERENSRVYVGCMKSGDIYTLPTQRWHEPEWWKFGDAKSYFRHATGQIYALSRALAVYVAVNRNQLHEYRNEDVSLGSWMIGLDASYVDERKLCCGSPPAVDCEQARSSGHGCIAVFDWQCSGLCNSAERMASIKRDCGTGQ